MTEDTETAPAKDPAADPMETLDRPLTTAQILWQERFELRDVKRARSCDHLGLSEEAYRASASEADMTALCLSGGGIRSAAFSLGVVQALASRKLLTSFDYLSTVSGGGYLGSFLQRWILGDPEDGRNEQHVQDQLAASLKDKTLPEIAQLREGANFITPKIGLMSSDTWAAIATSLRNVSVNWTLFVPMILIVAAIPPLFYWLLMGVDQTGARIALVLHWGAATWAMTGVYLGLPSNRLTGYWTPQQIRKHIMIPALVAMVTMLVIAAGPSPDLPWRTWWTDLVPRWIAEVEVEEKRQMLFAAMGFVGVPLTSFAVAFIFQFVTGMKVGKRIFYDLLLWVVCGLAGGIALYLVVVFAVDRQLLLWTEGGVVGGDLLVTVGPPLYVGCLLIVGWAFSVLRTAWRGDASRPSNEALRPDLDREWLVRISADLMRPVLLWSVLAALCLLVPYELLGLDYNSVGDDAPPINDWRTQLSLLGGAIASGLTGAFAGKSGATKWLGYVTKLLSLEVIALIATAVFVVVALLSAAHAVSDVALLANAYCESSQRCPGEPYWWMFEAHAALIALLLLFLLIWGRYVDANRFSLHGFYRNRLSRAFLGAARAGEDAEAANAKPDQRDPDPFTGIDPADNVRLHSLWPAPREHSEPCLFPVINVALNAVATKKLAWQQRKALPFVMTPLACGSGWLGKGDICSAEGAYIASNHYGGSERDEKLVGAGVTLAAAMAISGAAASPSMGYHSSPATAFLMTLFNVRLGAWMPNPAMWQSDKKKKWRLGIGNPVAGRRNGAMPLLRELTGSTREDSRDVYLSDGGHFENLGLYEMLRRRCTTIFVVDAGCDPDLAFEDLSNAARKAAIDLNVKLDFHHIRLASRNLPEAGSIAYAIADIDYPEDWKGRLIYLKPSLIDDLPIDVRAYAASSKTFPHETTADQWYTESQFESYRNLGATLFQTLCAARGDKDYEKDNRGRPLGRRQRLATFFDEVENSLKAPRTRRRKAVAED